MRSLFYILLAVIMFGCQQQAEVSENPFFADLNVAIDYANVTADDIEDYAGITVANAEQAIEKIKKSETSFNNVFIALDETISNLTVASNRCFMLYWVSPDSLSRVNGLAGYQLLDSLSTTIFSDKVIFDKMTAVKNSQEYTSLENHRKLLIDDLILNFEQSGVNLDDEKRAKFLELSKEISQLSSDYSNNMNSASEVLVLDEEGAKGLSENFKNTYKVADNKYEIPVINATRRPVWNNAAKEETRKAYYIKYYNIGAGENLKILDQLVQKRYELAELMGYKSYAEYNLYPKMAKNPETVWNFLNDLVDRSKAKAIADLKILQDLKNKDTENTISSKLMEWDTDYYKNQILKTQYNVDHEKIREYLPIEQCLAGIIDIYETLFGLEFRKIEDASVWHEEVDMYEIYDGETLTGRFYLDLFPRPNKESWFYGVELKSGRATKDGYEVPASMLLGNFTRPTEDLPSLISFNELNTLFHEFGHIMDGMSYTGEFALQADSKRDFVESMSQIFENWTMDYEMISSFAKHYETGEVLPKELFDNMANAKNVSSGYSAISSLRKCIYDMNLYDKYDPKNPINTDDLWKKIDKELGIQFYVDGTHPQGNWIHINTHPVYYYGYLWAEVYAQDMFSEFEKNGLLDTETGKRFRKLILANGQQRDIVEAVEEFLGRPSNNEAYIKSLGLN